MLPPVHFHPFVVDELDVYEFLSLTSSASLFFLGAMTKGSDSYSEAAAIASIIVIMVDLNESEYPLFWSLWLAVAHYPIRWLLTGNKSLLPWKNN